MSRAYDYWVYQQLEPNDIVYGNHKRFKDNKPTFIEKAESIDKLRKELGPERFKQMVDDDKVKYQQLKEENE